MDESSLKGRYRAVRLDLIEEKLADDDPRRPFYLAMLRYRTYEEYLAMVGDHMVELPGFAGRRVSGRDEIVRCRAIGWIADD